MNLKNLFQGNKETANAVPEAVEAPDTVPEQSSGNEDLAKAIIEQLIALDEADLLSRDIFDYISDEKFSELLSEFPVKAAVRIYDAEKSAEEAEERGRQSAVDEIYKRRSMPKSMQVGQPTRAITDFGKMTTEEFERFKKHLKS